MMLILEFGKVPLRFELRSWFLCFRGNFRREVVFLESEYPENFSGKF